MHVRFHAMFACLELLKKLNNINEQNGQMIPYHKFYIPDLKDRVNLRGDYVSWVQFQSLGFDQGVSLLTNICTIFPLLFLIPSFFVSPDPSVSGTQVLKTGGH